MERNDIGTNAATDDVSFGSSKTVGAASTGSVGASDTEVATDTGTDIGTDIGGTTDTSSADASGMSGTSGATADGKLATAKQKIGQAKEKVVDRMHATADWIKEKDIDQLKGTIEAQVRDHPGRTLLIAAGLGYLIGRAFRGGNSA